jgi:aspartyl protease family protein
MALSSGAQRAASMAAAWLVAGGSTAFSVLYFDEIKATAQGIFGVSGPAEPGRTEKRQAQWAEPVRALPRGGVVEIKAGSHGHYYASVEINGRPVDVMVDSGASIVALTFDDARRAGVHVRDNDYTHRVSTANGLARIAPAMLDRVSIGTITVRNVEAAVMEPGKLATSLLGMSFLARLQRVDMRKGTLVLQE